MKLLPSTILASTLFFTQTQAMEKSMQFCFTYERTVFSNVMRQKGFDRLANCPKPVLKIYEELDPQNKIRVIPLISDEFKITPKKQKTYIYVPSIKFGTVLTIITDNLVATGYFGDNCKTKAPLFLESILSNDSTIQSVSLISAYYAPTVQTIHDLLDEHGIKQRTYCDIFPAIFEGEINEKGEMTGISTLQVGSDSLGYESSDKIKHNYDEAAEKLRQKRPAPFKIAIDCSDGQFIDLYKPTNVRLKTGMSDPFGIFSDIKVKGLPLTILNVGAMSYYLHEKNVGDDEMSKLIDDLNLLNM